MKLFTVVVVALLAGVGLGYAATVAEFGLTTSVPELAGTVVLGGRRAKIVVEPMVHDFGRMLQNSKGEHTFVLRNDGLADLKITPGKPSCKCTVSNVSRRVIPPGETAEVTLTWKTGFARNKFAKSAPIATNDPENPEIRLKLQGFVFPEFSFEPNRVYLPAMSQHDAAEKECKLLFYEKESVEIRGHQLSDQDLAEHFKIEYRPIPKDELEDKDATSGMLVSVKITPGLPMGPFNQEVVFDTGAKTGSPVRLQITGNVQAAIVIYGREFDPKKNLLNLETLQGGEEHKFKVAMYLIGEDRHNVQVKVKETVPEDLQVTVGDPTDVPANRVQIPLTIVVPANANPAAYLGTEPDQQGRVVLETTHPQTPEMRFNVRVAVTD